jgi:hypothetical protein
MILTAFSKLNFTETNMKILKKIIGYNEIARSTSVSFSTIEQKTITTYRTDKQRAQSDVSFDIHKQKEPWSSSQLQIWLESFPNTTKRISLRSEGKVTDEFLIENLTRFSNLRFLDIGGIHGLTILGLEPVFRACPNIEVLDFNGSAGVVNDELLIIIAALLPNLRVLRISGGNHHVTDIGIMAIAEGCPNLENVDLTQCNLTGRGLVHLLSKCKIRLCNINLCGKIEKDAFLAFAEKPIEKLSAAATQVELFQMKIICELSKRLQYFNISKIAYISSNPTIPEPVSSLLKQYPFLSIENPQGKLIEDLGSQHF